MVGLCHSHQSLLAADARNSPTHTPELAWTAVKGRNHSSTARQGQGRGTIER